MNETMKAEQVADLIERISAVAGVARVNRWTVPGRDRLYIEFESQNRFAATGTVKIWVDLLTMTLEESAPLTKHDCSGARTYERVCEAWDVILAIVEG